MAKKKFIIKYLNMWLIDFINVSILKNIAE